MDGKVRSEEITDGNVKHVIINWRKGHPCDKAAENMAALCSCPGVLWKVQLASDTIGYLVEAISKPIVGGVAWIFLTAYSEM